MEELLKSRGNALVAAIGPAKVEPYIVYGGILVYVIGGLVILAFARKTRGPSRG